MDRAGVDKVGLHTRAFIVKDGLRGWQKKAGEKVGEDPPVFLHGDDGRPIQGTGFYLKTPTFIADLSPKGLLVTFNPSKVRHAYELLTDPAEVGRIGDDVQQGLKAHGLLVNVNAMQTTRIDLAKQAVLRHPLTSYVPALAHLQGKRMKGHKYPDGYAWRNTQREAVLYNKTREVYEKQGIAMPDRVGRMEAKWRKGRPLAKDFQFSAFGDLRRADPEQLATVYRMALHRDVFRTDPKAVQLVLNYDTEAAILRSYLQAGRGGAFRYLMDANAGPHVEALGGWDAFGDLCREAGMPDRTVRYTLHQLRQQAQRAAFVNARRDREAVNVHTLLDELKQTFAA